MSLNTKLTTMSKDAEVKHGPAIVKIMKESRQKLEYSGLHKEALGPGETMTDFVLLDSANQEFSSREALKNGPLLICWYRGIW